MIDQMDIPGNAIGCVGLLVALRRLRGMSDGRLGIVQRPAGWVTTVVGTERPVFAWEVMLTGLPIEINGQPVQRVVVADACLVPVSQFDTAEAGYLLNVQELHGVETTLTEKISSLDPEYWVSNDAEPSLHQALEKARLAQAQEVVDASVVFKELGFQQPAGPSSDSYFWICAFNGREVRMHAAPGMFEDWRIWINTASERTICGNERVVLNDWTRGRVVQAVLELWEDALGRASIPQVLQLGWIYRQHQYDLKKIGRESDSCVYVDGCEFRRVLRWLRGAYRPDETFIGPPRDVPIEVEFADGRVWLSTDLFRFSIGVVSGWSEKKIIQLSSLLAIEPARLRGHITRWE